MTGAGPKERSGMLRRLIIVTAAIPAVSALVFACYGPTAKGRRFVPKDDHSVLGYSTKGLVPRQFKTVAVPIFKNFTLYRRFEFELTQAVVEMIEGRTHLKVVNDPAQADTVLLGEILDFQPRVLTKNVNDQVQELRFNLVVSIRWKNLKNGATLVREDALRQKADAVVVRGENVFTANREAFKDIAELIVERMESDW